MTRAYVPETYKRVTFPGDRNVMGFGVYGKSNRNKRETGAETGLSSRIPHGMFIEDFMEKATGRCVRNQMGFMAQTARPGRIHARREKSLDAGRNPEKVRVFPGEWSSLHPCCQEFNVCRRFDWGLREPDRWRHDISSNSSICGFDDSIGKYHPSPDTVH